ncbi:MAG: CoA transferase [Rhodoferax sp.]|nr:CoA transferase [Rhodoferax sp.]
MKPYTGLRVVEFATVGGVPFCAWWLAQQGARVLRVQAPRPPELGVPVPAHGDIGQWQRGTVVLDLKTAEGRDAALRALDDADVAIEGYRAGVMERLGLGPADCHARHPALVYVRLAGWERSGEWAQRAGHDINYAAMAGALHATGPDHVPLNLIADIGGGALYACAGIGAALHARASGGGGRGCVVDVAMTAGSAHLLSAVYGRLQAGAWNDRAAGNVIDGGVPWYRTYRTRDERHMAVGAIEERFYRNLLQALELDATQLPARSDAARWGDIAACLQARFAQHDQAHWARHFETVDACVTPVLSLHEARAHPVNRHVFRAGAPAAVPAAVPDFFPAGA